MEKAVAQDVGEVIVAYTFIRDAGGFPNRLSLDLAVEAWFEEMKAPIDFDVRGAVDKLTSLGLLIQQKGSNHLKVFSEDDGQKIIERSINSALST